MSPVLRGPEVYLTDNAASNNIARLGIVNYKLDSTSSWNKRHVGAPPGIARYGAQLVQLLHYLLLEITGR